MPELLAQPIIKEWMAPEEIAFRENAVGYLFRASEIGLLPAPVTGFGVFPNGESSVVFKVNPNSEPYVVKMTLHPSKLAIEAAALTAWRTQGVATPQVYSSHAADTSLPVSLSTLEFIDAPSLSDSIAGGQRVDLGISRELGRTLAIMHQVRASGFGAPQLPGLNGDKASLSEEVLPTLDRRLAQLVQRQILTDSDVAAVHKALAILEQDSSTGNVSSLTHNDFLPYNILAGPKLIVFDPDTLVTHPLLDLATTLLVSDIAAQPYGFKEPDEILAGYKEVSPVNPRLLSAAIAVRTVRKLNTWAHKNRARQVEASVALLRKNTPDL